VFPEIQQRLHGPHLPRPWIPPLRSGHPVHALRNSAEPSQRALRCPGLRRTV
jgi:hypothetical protein